MVIIIINEYQYIYSNYYLILLFFKNQLLKKDYLLLSIIPTAYRCISYYNYYTQLFISYITFTALIEIINVSHYIL